MNSLLQCLYYISELREYFIKRKKFFTSQQPLCKALAEVIYGLKYDKKDYFEATEFKKEMGEINGLFKGIRPGDSKDLYINIISSLLRELSVSKEDNTESEEDVDSTKKLEVFKATYDEIDDNIINNLFMGFYETINKCNNFNKINNYMFNVESFISFNLEEISKYYQNNSFSLEDCFEYNYNRSYKDSIFCGKCKVIEEEVNSNNIIFIPPKILVLILDRGKGKTFKGNVTFKNDLDLTELIDQKENEYKFSNKYKLIGVCTHEGSSSASGHYTACCLTDNGKFYYFSDSYVREAKEYDIYNNDPCLLFYKRLDTISTPN